MVSLLVALVPVLALALAACSPSGDEEFERTELRPSTPAEVAPPARPAPASAGARPSGRAAAVPAWADTVEDGQWLMPAKNWASTRYSGLDQINTSNVHRLQLAWTFRTSRVPSRTCPTNWTAWAWEPAVLLGLAWLLPAAALWLWHAPRWYDAAVADDALHALEHASFVVTALLFW